MTKLRVFDQVLLLYALKYTRLLSVSLGFVTLRTCITLPLHIHGNAINSTRHSWYIACTSY